MIGQVASILLIVHLKVCIDVMRESDVPIEFTPTHVCLLLSFIGHCSSFFHHTNFLAVTWISLTSIAHFGATSESAASILATVWLNAWKNRSIRTSLIHSCSNGSLSKLSFYFDEVLNKNALIMIQNHLFLSHMIFMEVLIELTGFHHLRLDIDNPVHDLLIFSIDSFRLLFL